MIRRVTFIIGLVTAVHAHSEPIEVACYWDSLSLSTSGGSAIAAGLFNKASEPAYFRIDVSSGTVAHADPTNIQTIVFPLLHLESDASTVKLVAPAPNIKGLKEGNAKIQISIDRYTLESSMVLVATSPSSKTLAGQWIRLGRCSEKRF